MQKEKLEHDIFMQAGGSYDKDLNPVKKKSGYFVSIKDLKKVNTIEAAADYLIIYSKDLEDNQYIGVWYFAGVWFIDLSIHIEDLEEALKIGKENNQLAIWDCENQKSIML